MRFYTVTGLVDEEMGVLYPVSVLMGRHDALDTRLTTEVDGRELTRFIGFFEADSPDEAELIAVSLVAQYADDQAAMWSQEPNRHTGKYIEDVDTKGKLLLMQDVVKGRKTTVPAAAAGVV